MEKLKAELDKLIDRLERAPDFRDRLENLVSVYPFNEYEYVISHLLAARKLSIDEYHELHLNRENMPEFTSYAIQAVDIRNAIILAYKRQHHLNEGSGAEEHKRDRMMP